MKNILAGIIALLMAFNLLLAEIHLTIGDYEMNALDTVTMEFSLSNPDDAVYGLQFQIEDLPNYGQFIGIEATERTASWMFSFNDIGGIATIVGFDISLSPIEAGDGPIFTMQYESTSPYSSDISLTLIDDFSILSDQYSNPLPFTWSEGSVTVNGEDPPPLLPPIDLTAVGGFQLVNLSWSHNEPDNVTGYNIYRDGSFIGSTEAMNYIDTGLAYLIEYCYTVSAYNQYLDSDISEEACATTEDIYLPPPQNLTSNEDGLLINLAWDPPEGVLGECEDQYGFSYVPDCSGDGDCCPESWIGDGWADCSDQPWGCDLTCYNCDGGDCPDSDPGCGGTSCEDEGMVTCPDGTCAATADDCPDCPAGYVLDCADADCCPESWIGDGFADCEDQEFGCDLTCYDNDGGDCDGGSAALLDDDKMSLDEWLAQLKDPDLVIPGNSREFIQYEVYRDNVHISTTTDTEYGDVEGLEFLVEYCYTITATYDEGESGVSNQSCSTPQLEAPSSLTAMGGDHMIALTWLAPPSSGQSSYTIYRDGDVLATDVAAEAYNDLTAEINTDYCYSVIAIYDDLGASPATNTSCTMWFLMPPAGTNAVGDNDEQNIQITWDTPGTNVCADALIPSLPFNDIASNAGAGDDWACQVYEQGADYSYLLYVSSPIVIDITLCSDITDYDTALEIFTADGSCNESTTGYYVDDDFENCPDYVAPYPPSGLWGVALDPGEYYIVVDGFGGDEGNFEISVSESGRSASAPATIEENLALASLKVGNEITIDDIQLAAGNGENEVENTREITGYRLYKDSAAHLDFDAGTFEYTDEDTEHDVQYCYYVTTLYDDGESIASNTSCASWILPAAANLIAEPGFGDIALSWSAANSTEVNNYTLYRDYSELTTTADLTFLDDSAEHDVEYCYTVVANYELGQSQSSNEVCTMWQILPPGNFTAEAGDAVIYLTWTDPDVEPPNDCGEGLVPDCADDDCCPESWIGDGWADCEDQAFGCDLTCYDNDGGDCDGRAVGTGNGLRRELGLNNSEKTRMSLGLNLSNDGTNGPYSRDLISTQIYRDGEFLDEVESDVYSYDDFDVVNGIESCYMLLNVYEEGDSPSTPEACTEPCSDSPAPENLAGELSEDGEMITLIWEAPMGECEDLPPYECGEGLVVDCSWDGDCCPEGWIGDGLCDGTDQQWGCDLTCYDNDGGDCVDPFCGDGLCNGYETEADCPEDCAPSEECMDCEIDYTNYGSECCDTAWYEFGIDCATLEANYGWDCTGCGCPGDSDPVCGDGFCNGDEDYYSCPEDCNEPGTCDDGFVSDCADDDCCLESWIGDGFADCEDQAYGCDLTCYDNDGGDCDGIFMNQIAEKMHLNAPVNVQKDMSLVVSPFQSREVTGFQVYRDGEMVAELASDVMTYEDTIIEDGMEYCYYLIAVYEDGNSDPGAEVCVTTLELTLNGQGLPEYFSITGIYPNPFNPVSNISYGLPEPGLVEIQVYDLAGRLVENLFRGRQEAGYYQLSWNAETQSSGMYFVQVSNARETLLQKIILMK